MPIDSAYHTERAAGLNVTKDNGYFAWPQSGTIIPAINKNDGLSISGGIAETANKPAVLLFKVLGEDYYIGTGAVEEINRSARPTGLNGGDASGTWYGPLRLSAGGVYGNRPDTWYYQCLHAFKTNGNEEGDNTSGYLNSSARCDSKSDPLGLSL